MNEHDGWDLHDEAGYELPEEHGDDLLLPEDEVLPQDDFADDGWDEPPPVEPFGLDGLPGEPPAAEVADETAAPAAAEVVGADPDAAAEPRDDPAPAFPPMVDVGALPEPVDGFPWIDTGHLGIDTGHLGVAPAPAEQTPDPAELAAYAATDLPPGQDPWAALAASDDPATSALARFYAPDGGEHA